MLLDRFIFRSHLSTDEKLVYVVHQHWFAVYKPICKTSFFGLVVPAVLWLMFPGDIAFWIFGVWFVIGFASFLYEVVNWYFDVLLITTCGVIDLSWRGIFDKSSTRINFEAIIGTSYDKIGFWSNIFNFGMIVVEKEGYGENKLSLPWAVNPQLAEREILETREKCLHQKGLEDERVLRDILSGMVKEHVRGEREKKTKLADMI